MHTRFIPLVVLSAALAFACGPRARSNEATTHAKGTPGQPVGSMLDVRIEDGVVFALRVTNDASKSLELTFPDGQTHDIVVLDANGREVWRWSKGRLFTQALQNRVLAQSETASYEGEWSPRDTHGTFTAVASLRSENHPIEQRVQFTLP
jgi:hypothetical protein